VNEAQKADIKALMQFYDEHGWDWSKALEFQVRSYNESLDPIVIRTRIGAGRPRSKRNRK
jgi:hypothetical protein